MKLMHGCNQKQTCHICKEVVTSWFMVEKTNMLFKRRILVCNGLLLDFVNVIMGK
jgi:hypothetical protein